MLTTTLDIQSTRKPNPIRRFIAWGQRIDHAAAWDSARSVFALVGVGAFCAYLGTMPPVLVPVAVAVLSGAWYADYLRHF